MGSALPVAEEVAGASTDDDERCNHQTFPALPNLIIKDLFLGHQGHAVTISRWAHLLGISHVVNLAENRVPSACDDVIYLRASEGCALRDVATEAEAESFVRASDELIPAMESALQGGGRLFVHCQQGRSRSCSLVVAYLMRCKRYSARRAMELVAACR